MTNATKGTFSTNTSTRVLWLKALAIIVITVAVYFQALYGGFIWDDQVFIVENRFLLDLAGLRSIWFTNDLSHQYYPLVTTSFWLERHIFGLNPFGYHAVNIALHAINAVLVWLICRRLKIRGAWVAALIFALHPVHVDSVAFINERKNMLSGLFYLSAFLAYLSSEDRKKWMRWYALASFCFILALLSKTVAGTLPAALIIIRWMRGRNINTRYIAALVPAFALSALMAFVTISVEVEKTGVDIGLSLAERIVLAGRASWFYIYKLFLPVELLFIYPKWTIDASSTLQWLYPASVVALLILLFVFSRRIGRVPLSAAALFLVTIFPALGFVDINYFNYSFVSDHFQYLASLGIIVPVVGLGAFLLRRSPRSAQVTTALIVLSLLAALTWRHSGLGTDHKSLWKYTLAKNPTSAAAHNNLGNIFFNQKDNQQAIEHFEAAIRINPDFEKARNNLANALTRTGHYDEAIAQYMRSLEILPNQALTYINLGINQAEQGRFPQAVKSYEKAIDINPYDPYAYYNLALSLVAQGKTGEAVEAYTRAIELNPDDADSRNNLANIFFADGKLKRAKTLYLEAVNINPVHAQANNNLGIIMSIEKKNLKSLTYFKTATKVDPSYPDAHFNMGITLADLGRIEEAKKQYLKVIKLAPNYAEAYNNLGSLLLKEGNFKDAATNFRVASTLEPEAVSYKKNLQVAERLLKGIKDK